MGGLVPTSEVVLTPPEREQSARSGTETEEDLGLVLLSASGSMLSANMKPLVVKHTVPTKNHKHKYCTLV